MNRQMRIAVAAEFRKLADRIEREEKSKFLLENDPGTRIPVMSDVEVDGKKRRIGYVLISDPEGPRDMPVITDEAAAIAWALKEFNDPMLAEHKLTEQGRKTVLASASAALTAGAPLPPGVEVQHVPGGNPTVSWRGEYDARELLEDMQSRGLFSLSSALRMKELP
ncbi:HNH endonuclease [Mycobacterium phage prophiGD91-2]|uniref:hypothetical protein n=1 Tax=Mycobacteroides abscessus TaxID=36809 RepID=UPI000928B90E|nr:hypothetical protein [Mycobacteroides abscessus]QSM03882.1 HNH endonuclease [Mycobacterium phage prophiGD91-2]QSM90497.1 hypothetical protein I3U44_07450 [Mycobacteroides abscessus subsp. bolletii]QSM90783.1 hypothetical protein I3U44_09095 [Mycobacteroides abscessus subsp. bolletii]SIJ02309.1 Uncharacterised protein [Mycobacteroides abscessus subsp. bolletii]SLD37459.1 Uncharacterised protein [Mycobacteroides abscessus subsp. bolletii]